MPDITVNVTCKTCGKTQEITVDSAGYKNWLRGTSIQFALPNSSEFDREVLLSRMCYSCLSATYNEPAPGKDWGEPVLDCYCCGANLYERNRNESGDLICPCCGSNQKDDTY